MAGIGRPRKLLLPVPILATPVAPSVTLSWVFLLLLPSRPAIFGSKFVCWNGIKLFGYFLGKRGFWSME